MHLLDMDSIIIKEGRQRTVFADKALAELRSTMERFLLHPITVTSLDSPVLIAGERRLKTAKAMRDDGIPITFMGEKLPLGKIPVIPFNQPDAVLIYEAELAENIHRNDLTWQERAMATAKFHELQAQRAAAAGKEQTFVETAKALVTAQTGKLDVTEKEVQHLRQAVALDVQLGKALETDFELASAKTLADAKKIIKKRREQEERKLLLSTLGDMSNFADLRNGDSFDLIKTVPDGSVHVVVTDPPYGVDMHLKGTFSVDNHDYDDSAVFMERMLRELPPELFRVMAADSHGYIFTDWRYFARWSTELALAGFIVWPRPIIWDKGTVGATTNPDFGPRFVHEYIVYFRKGQKKIDSVYCDVIRVNNSVHNTHPAGKPVELFQFLLERSGLPGETALDLFAGGGPIIAAAHKAKMRVIAFELNPEYFVLCQTQLATLGENHGTN